MKACDPSRTAELLFSHGRRPETARRRVTATCHSGGRKTWIKSHVANWSRYLSLGASRELVGIWLRWAKTYEIPDVSNTCREMNTFTYFYQLFQRQKYQGFKGKTTSCHSTGGWSKDLGAPVHTANPVPPQRSLHLMGVMLEAWGHGDGSSHWVPWVPQQHDVYTILYIYCIYCNILYMHTWSNHFFCFNSCGSLDLKLTRLTMCLHLWSNRQ